MTAPGDDGQNASEEDGAERPTWPDEPEDWEPPAILGIEGEYGDIFEEFDSYAEYQSYREELEERVIEVSLAELIFEGLPDGWCESADPTPHELLGEQIGQIDVEGKYLDFEATPNSRANFLPERRSGCTSLTSSQRSRSSASPTGSTENRSVSGWLSTNR
ncbi:hypothetical protein [Halorubrum vacuolatum]|uniref:Uncharacterized protein n=1 Tax=Halorubrum vacuolatum TaxID=63740 RepID=A0A238W9T3_HALVU|nr:hypothetical protein [Halorubrum vacuolatum]SNR43044.1 hypothetical protein SAMN06264855_10657 [Halorubrum vacuolatum]